MENAAEALKIAFAVMLFVMALTLSMSSFSQARIAVNAITSARDRDIEWAGDLNNDGDDYNDGYYKYNMYVTPSENLTRTVGIETVVTSMYRAYEENMTIYFLENNGTTPLVLYNELDNKGNIVLDGGVSSIDLSNETFGAQEEPKEFLDIIIGGKKVLNEKDESIQEKYKNKIFYEDGLYNELKNSEFEEKLGEYTDSTGLTKRVITYIKK